MTGLSLLLAFAFLVTAFLPETQLGKLLRRTLVVRPAEVLNGGPLKVIVALVVLAGVVVFVVAAPEWVALMGMADLSLYLDLAVLSFLLGAVGSLKTASRAGVGVAKQIASRLTLAKARLKRLGVRARRARKPRHGPAADDSWPSGVWAAA